MSDSQKIGIWIVTWRSIEYPGEYDARFAADDEAKALRYAALLTSRGRLNVRVQFKEVWPS